MPDSKTVVLVGRIENPTLTCPKAIRSCTIKQDILPLAVKRNIVTQKFKLPFKNCSSNDTEFEFIFIKSVKQPGLEVDVQYDVFSCMTFYC